VVLGIAGAGGFARVVYTITLGQHVKLGFLSDAGFYSGAANALADGQGYIDIFRKLLTGEAPHTAEHPPGWPALLAVFSKLGVTTELGQRLVGVAVGVGVIVLVGMLASRLAGRTAGRAAATLAALHPTLIAADGSLMAETLAGLLLVAVVLVAVGAAERPTAARALGLGILIGAAALVRGEALLYTGLVVVPVAFAAGRRQRPRAGTLVRIGGAALAGVFLVVAPWTVRNAVQMDGFIVISTNESAALAGANCDAAYEGPAIGGWEVACVFVNDAPHAVRDSEVEAADRWRRQGLDYLRAHVDRLPAVVSARLGRTLGIYRAFPPAAEGRDEGVQAIGSVVWLVALVPLAVVGAVLLARRRPLHLALVVAPLVSSLVVTVVGYGALRFRHPMELMAVVLAGVALGTALDRWRASTHRSRRRGRNMPRDLQRDEPHHEVGGTPRNANANKCSLSSCRRGV
jgi:4-amino-4-deoxy-L-arabinose transferase-like glycosyltransferase